MIILAPTAAKSFLGIIFYTLTLNIVTSIFTGMANSFACFVIIRIPALNTSAVVLSVPASHALWIGPRFGDCKEN